MMQTILSSLFSPGCPTTLTHIDIDSLGKSDTTQLIHNQTLLRSRAFLLL